MNEIDINIVKEIGLRLSKPTEKYRQRYFVDGLKIGAEPRIKILRGFRGLGKTTALLQLLNEKAIYFSVDNPYIEQFQLYELGKKLAMTGHTTILIDEIHKSTMWKRDTKALYDEFPSLTIIASGSAPLAFEPERRYEIIEVEPLSFREFLSLKGIEFEEKTNWEDNEATLRYLAENQSLYGQHEEYMNGGAFPTFFSQNEKTLTSIYYSIRKSIREDAVILAKVDGETVMAMERTVIFLASSPLGEFSINNLSRLLEIDKHKAYYMVRLLEFMKILRLVKPDSTGAGLIRGDPKLMFYHPNLRRAITNAMELPSNRGAEREELAVFAFFMRGWSVNTIKGERKSPDYIVKKGSRKLVVEIGGASKKKKQLAGFKEETVLIGDRQLMMLGLF